MQFFKASFTLLLLLVVVGFGLGRAHAQTGVDDLLLRNAKYVYNPPEFTVCTTETTDCKPVGEKDEFLLVHKPGTSSCPAGYYFMLNTKERVAEPVNTATCDPSLTLSFAQSSRSLDLALFGRPIGSIPLDREAK